MLGINRGARWLVICALTASVPLGASGSEEGLDLVPMTDRCAAGHGRSCFGVAVAREREGAATLAVDLYDQACRGGYARACFNLAILLIRDPELSQDPLRSKELLRAGCAGGHARSCRSLKEAAPQIDFLPPSDPALAALKRRCNRLEERACERLGRAYADRQATRRRRSTRDHEDEALPGDALRAAQMTP